jgi:DNA-binding NarL/FixJ family response regulator
MGRRRDGAGLSDQESSDQGSSDQASITVLVVDDQRVVRDGLTMLLGLMDGVEVVGTAANGAEAITVADTAQPDVVLMDLRMPGVDGVEATRVIRSRQTAAIVILTTYVDDESLFPALQAGASGYLTKDASAEQIEEAIRAVQRGETWLDPLVQARLVAAVAPPSDPGRPPDRSGEEGSGKGRSVTQESQRDGLTARETEVLRLIAAGLSNQEIGTRLYLGQATVKTHVNRIFAKTGVRDRAGAVRYAYRSGLADPS